VVVHVSNVSDALARIQFAGATINPATPVDVRQNLAVTLDAGPSVGASSFKWARVSGPAVSLGTTDQSKLTFTMPKTNQNLVLELTAANPNANAATCALGPNCSEVKVTLRPQPDPLTSTKARCVTNGARWVIDGTATSTKSNKVTVYSGRGLTADMKIGTSDVLPDGTWSVDERDSVVPTTTCRCVTAVSDRGGKLEIALEKPENLPPTTVGPGVPPADPAPAAAASAGLAAAVPFAGAAAIAPARIAAPATVTAQRSRRAACRSRSRSRTARASCASGS
jgi:hypothetical protein